MTKDGFRGLVIKDIATSDLFSRLTHSGGSQPLCHEDTQKPYRAVYRAVAADRLSNVFSPSQHLDCNLMKDHQILDSWCTETERNNRCLF